jgi:hypothetical protein
MTTKQPISNPLDVFVTTTMERKILDIFANKVAEVSPRKRKNVTLYAVGLLRGQDAPRFQDALAQALVSIEKQGDAN